MFHIFTTLAGGTAYQEAWRLALPGSRREVPCHALLTTSVKELGGRPWGSWKIGQARHLNGYLVERGSIIETTNQPNHYEDIALDYRYVQLRQHAPARCQP